MHCDASVQQRNIVEGETRNSAVLSKKRSCTNPNSGRPVTGTVAKKEKKETSKQTKEQTNKQTKE